MQNFVVRKHTGTCPVCRASGTRTCHRVRSAREVRSVVRKSARGDSVCRLRKVQASPDRFGSGAAPRTMLIYFLSQKKNSRSRMTIRISNIRVPDRPDEPDRSGRSGRESGSRLGMFGTALRCGAGSSLAGSS